MAKRDIKLRYRQTVLGSAWVLIQPLMGAGIFTFVFAMIAGMKAPGVPYFVFSFAGMLAWNLFSATLSRSGGALLGNAGLVAKVYFPRLLLPLSAILSGFLDFLVASVLLAVMLAISGIVPGVGLLLLPFWIAVLTLLALGAGLWVGALAVRYRDVNHILPVATQMLLFASPVAYSSDNVPERFRTAFSLNPLAAVLDGFRACIYGAAPPELWVVCYAVGFALVLFGSGLVYFARAEGRFADVI